MKPIKRIVSILLVLLLLALAGCAIPDGGADQPVDLPIHTRGPETHAGSAESSAEPLKTEAGTEPVGTEAGTEAALQVTEDGVYDSKEELALYIHLYRHLPSNYITKKEAEKLGWPGGDLRPYAPGKCIGGSHFGNYEGLLPEAKGRSWTECDIDTMDKKSRGAKRIIFSNDGLIYYTEDHYESFELLYDGWED